MSDQDPFADELKQLHESEGELLGHTINDDTKCAHCGKQLRDWKAGESCPERNKNNQAGQ